MLMKGLLLLFAAVITWGALSIHVMHEHHLRKPMSKVLRRRHAYVFLDIGFDFKCQLNVQLRALNMTGVKEGIDIVVMTQDAELLKAAIPEYVVVQQVPHAVTRGSFQWKTSYDKLLWSTLTLYDRIVFIEIDDFILGNLDHLFEYSPFLTTFAAPRAYWMKQPYIQTGPVVGDPSLLSVQRHFRHVLYERYNRNLDGDNDWTNLEFIDAAPILHGFYALLISEWIPGDPVYNYWGAEFNMTPAQVYATAKLVHFISPGHKPWHVDLPTLMVKHPTAPAEYFEIYRRWYALQEAVCLAVG